MDQLERFERDQIWHETWEEHMRHSRICRECANIREYDEDIAFCIELDRYIDPSKCPADYKCYQFKEEK